MRCGRTRWPITCAWLASSWTEEGADSRDQHVQLEWFGQVVVRSRLEALHHVVGAPARRQHQDRHIVAFAPQVARHIESVDARQHHVEHDEIDRVFGGSNAVQRLLAGVDDLGVVTFGFEIEAEPVGQVELVFDDENSAHAEGAVGSCSVKVLPCPGPGLSANTRPPCFLATELTMNRPSPVPLIRIATASGMR